MLKTAPFPALKRGQSKGIQHAVSSRPSNDGADLREPIRRPRPHPSPLLPRTIPSHRQCMRFTVASPPDKPRDPLAMRDVKCSCMLRAARAWNQPWSLCRRRHGRRVGSGETWWTKSGSKLPYRRVVWLWFSGPRRANPDILPAPCFLSRRAAITSTTSMHRIRKQCMPTVR